MISKFLMEWEKIFYTEGNQVGGIRLRKAYQDIKVLMQETRTEVTEL